MVSMVRRSSCMGGHLTDLKDLKKKHVRKLKTG